MAHRPLVDPYPGTVCLQLGCDLLIPEGSASGRLCPTGELGNAWRYFWLSQLASSMGRLRMSLNTLQCTGQPPTPIKSYPTQNVSSAKVSLVRAIEKPRASKNGRGRTQEHVRDMDQGECRV